MSDVERLTANNQARVRYAEELAEAKAERSAAQRKLREDAMRYERKRAARQTGAVILHMVAGWLCAGVGLLIVNGYKPAALFVFGVAILAMFCGGALEDGV